MTSAILPVFGPPPVVFERGEGVRLFDSDGRSYLDFISGIAVNALGHCHPHMVRTLTEQAGKLWHVSNMFRIPGQERLAERYCALTFADRAYFTNSGSEAVESAIKIARRYHWSKGAPERLNILSFTGSFHGRTMGAISAGGQEKYREGFGPRMQGFETLEWGDHDALKAAVARPDTCAVIVEPVQGEGGVRAMPEHCLKALRELCTAHGVLLIYDEVQCGASRTGKLFAHEWVEGAEPDILAAAKGIGAGFPLGMVLCTEEAGSGMVKGIHGTTYGGNPLAMAVGNAALDILSDPEFLEQVRRIAGHLTQAMEGLKDRHAGYVVDITGKGLLRGLKLSRDPMPVRQEAMSRGLLIGTAGDNVVRFAPPLVIGDADIREAVDILDATLSHVRSQD